MRFAWILTPSLKLRPKRSSQTTTMVSLGWDPGHELIPDRPRHQAAGHHAGEDELLAEAVVGQPAELRIEVAVTLADPGVAVGFRAIRYL